MTKKIAIGTRPVNKPVEVVETAGDAWVENREEKEIECIKRLTIDIPESLHRKIKAQCASRGSKISDELRELLLQKYGNT